MAHLEVRNWEKFQHYKHRNPPWIRLYVALLDDLEFARLPDVTKAHLVAIWMLAGRYHNRLPDDLKWLEQKMNTNQPVDWGKLLNDGWVTVSGDASDVLAQCKQNATTEQSRAENTEQSIGAVAPEKRQSKPRTVSTGVTWLTPFGEDWKQELSGVPNYKAMAKPFEQLLTIHTVEEIRPVWRAYLRGTKGQPYPVQPQRFCENFGKYQEQIRPLSPADVEKWVAQHPVRQ